MQETEYEEFSKLVQAADRAIKQATDVEWLTIVQEEQSIHFHLWFFPWTQAVIASYGKPSLSKIRGIMADYGQQSIGERSIARIKHCWHKVS